MTADRQPLSPADQTASEPQSGCIAGCRPRPGTGVPRVPEPHNRTRPTEARSSTRPGSTQHLRWSHLPLAGMDEGDVAGRMSRPVRRVLSLSAVTRAQVAAIHLRRTLPHASSGLPGSSGEQPSNAPCLALLQVGFTEPHRSPGALVVSYTTVSPLPRRPTDRSPASGVAVCSLWHCPAGHPGWALPTTSLCGARTFLGGSELPTRPPGRLIRSGQPSRGTRRRRPARVRRPPTAARWPPSRPGSATHPTT
jgi:hypothetical protein